MRIIIATGGTAGHLFPAIKTAEKLRKEGHEVILAGSFGMGLDKIKASGFTFENIPGKGLTARGPIDLIQSFLMMGKAAMKSLAYLKKVQPDVVVGFGGYGAFPLVMSGTLLKIPTLIHEQNVVPGRANKILSKYVKKIAVSFNESRRYFPENKVALTGYPSHIKQSGKNRERIIEEFGLQGDLKTILIFGGSQGSQKINQIFCEAIPILKKKFNFQVIHICGKSDYVNLKEQYNKIRVPVALYDFFNSMELAYAVADIIVCRSGAGTVTEIAQFNKKAIFIPYQHAQGHQKENAKVLLKPGMASILEEMSIHPERLAQEIEILLLNDVKDKYDDVFFEDSVDRIAQEILKLK